MVSLGHRRIAHLAGPMESPVFRARRDSYLAVMQEAGLASHARTVVAPSYDLGGGRWAWEMLAGADRPTAVICGSDEMAILAGRERRGPPASSCRGTWHFPASTMWPSAKPMSRL